MKWKKQKERNQFPWTNLGIPQVYRCWLNQPSWTMWDSTQSFFLRVSRGQEPEPRESGCLAGDGKFTIFIILIAVVDPISCLSLSSSSFLCCSLEACNAFANSRSSSSSSCQLSGWSMMHVSPWKVLCSMYSIDICTIFPCLSRCRLLTSGAGARKGQL